MGPPDRRTAPPTIIAVSSAMRRAVELARRFAPLKLPVLLIGETGTGKEVIAQAIHRWSCRVGELIDVNCGAMPPGMAAAELFGHRRGAYTTALESVPGVLQQADRGTLFLDELASLSPEGQAALLRVLETGEVLPVGGRVKQRIEIRLVAAVQDNLASHRQEGRIRQDLYHRLAGGVILLPPLRARPEDLLPLARHLAADMDREIGDAVRGLLERHHWPGNVRELRNVIHRAASLSDEMELPPGAIAEAMELGMPEVLGGGRRLGGSPLGERKALALLCRQHAGCLPSVAAALGVSRATVYRRLKRLGLTLNGSD